ncbi:DnaJ-class molecular chaperone [Geomicrobium halophilum]|uniref:DnaJ-class molecular chaperone n=1 Tax=Geomicrobium halophilum TaxID=549000 RepID=A0A841Q054_9BACL|nr:hypothetical protein [Geomicrobium halophilum]MBB6450435.1 DnaJ-class molecular chaperone [Geomicrobium halophilum]
MNNRENTCSACDGSGLLMDDEQWKYPCTICGGDGIFKAGDSPEQRPIDVDDMNRTLE